jgi:hypothetical protein
VSGAVFKTVSAPVRAGAGGFDSHTPPPKTKDEGGRMEDELEAFTFADALSSFTLHPSAL